MLTELLKHGRNGLSPGERLCAVFSNAGSLIVPIVQGMLGEEYIIFTCPYILLQNVLMWTYGLNVIGGAKGPVWKVLLKPNFLAIVTGLIMFIFGLRFPAPLGKAIDNLGSCTGTLSMVIIGILLAETDLKAAMKNIRIYRTLLLRLILFPFLAMALVLLAPVYGTA